LGLVTIPSVTNFILVNVGVEGKAVADALLRNGVIVRSMEGYGLPTYIRVTVGTPQENSRALQALAEVLGTVAAAARSAGPTEGRSKR